MVVLHPRHKLEWFRQANWISSKIDMMEQLVRDEFRKVYIKRPVHNNDSVELSDSSMQAATSKDKVTNSTPCRYS